MRWNRTLAAQALGVSRMTLWKKMKRFGLLADADAPQG
jgi:transcriptional regulator of acetoin/glycerol metabolism